MWLALRVHLTASYGAGIGQLHIPDSECPPDGQNQTNNQPTERQTTGKVFLSPLIDAASFDSTWTCMAIWLTICQLLAQLYFANLTAVLISHRASGESA